MKITLSEATINRKLVRALSIKLHEQDFWDYVAYDTYQDIINFLTAKFVESDTYQSLIGGDLRAEFGLDDAAVANLQEVIYNLINVNFINNYAHRKRGRMSNEFEIANQKIGVIAQPHTPLGKKEFNNAMSQAAYYSNGYLVDWLRWLLWAGVETVIEEYRVLYQPGIGRSEMAIMIGPKDYRSYQVDERFAGTPNNNWVTKIVDANKAEIFDIIKKSLAKKV